MAYLFPEDFLAWYVAGDRMGLITTKSTSSKNRWESIDESQTDGLLIEYTAQPETVDNISDVPAVDDTIHIALVNYVNWKLFEDRQDEASLIASNKYRGLWTKKVKEEAGRDKVGGVREIAPFGFSWPQPAGRKRNYSSE